jgi:hypothetical protein
MALRKERPGFRLVVHAREYTGSTWTINHNIENNQVFTQALTLDFKDMIPKNISKSGDRQIQIEWPQSVTGIGVVFRNAGITGNDRLNFTNVDTIDLYHKYENKNFLVQFWDTNDKIIYPRVVKKIGSNILRVTFFKTTSGYVDMALSINGDKQFNVATTDWSNPHKSKEDREHISAQCIDVNDNLFVPETIKRIDTNRNQSSDDNLIVTLSTKESGILNAIIYGYRI